MSAVEAIFVFFRAFFTERSSQGAENLAPYQQLMVPL